MIEFLKILFLSKFVLLTPDPVTIQEQYTFTLKEPISAMNYHARLSIDVTGMLNDIKGTGIINELDILESRFPQGSVIVYLKESNTGAKLTLNELSYSTSSDSLELSVKYPKDAELDRNYDTVTIYSKVLLEDVLVGWANSK
ncbi:hypothetical protein ACMZOO_10965 [Catenovulum sp. SX2]|uniref:hypothetical protein n=1 Tax=Catenovulum sp. SX2 TaxID=3398614 RepID=UPI003F83829B